MNAQTELKPFLIAWFDGKTIKEETIYSESLRGARADFKKLKHQEPTAGLLVVVPIDTWTPVIRYNVWTKMHTRHTKELDERNLLAYQVNQKLTTGSMQHTQFEAWKGYLSQVTPTDPKNPFYGQPSYGSTYIKPHIKKLKK